LLFYFSIFDVDREQADLCKKVDVYVQFYLNLHMLNLSIPALLKGVKQKRLEQK